MTFTFPVEKDDFTAENGITYSWATTHWRVKSFKNPDGQTVVVDEDPPDPAVEGQLWFCSEPDDLTLYVFDGENWIPASPPVSLDGITQYTEDLQRQIMTLAKNQTPYEVFLDSAEKVKEDQDRQDQNIITLQEEIEQLAPSLERGVWEYSPHQTAPGKGQYSLAKFMDEQAQQDKCNAVFLQCKKDCNGDVSCESECSRRYQACVDSVAPEGYYQSVQDWSEATHILFNKTDQREVDHTFKAVTPGLYLDVFNSDNADFMIAIVGERINEATKPDVVGFPITVEQDRGKPDGLAGIKFFEVDLGIDVANYVRKTGDEMSGHLHILQGEGGGHSKGNVLVVNQDSAKGGSIARFQQDGQDVLKLTADGELECWEHKITRVGDAEEGKDALNLRKGKELFVEVAGDTIEGRLDIKKPQDADKPDNSFYITAPMWNETDGKYETGALIKDYRPSGKQTNGQNSSIWYHGDIKEPQHIVNKDYIDSKKSWNKAPWTHGPGSMFHKYLDHNGEAPVKNKDKWTHGVCHYHNKVWSMHTYSLNDWTSMLYDNKTYSPPTPQPYIVWNYLESTGIWAKVEIGTWKTTKWNDSYCIVFELDTRTTWRPLKEGDILCTQFTGFW